MGLPQTKPIFDAAAYLEWEATQSERHEFVAGEAFAMAGAGDAHNTIAGNLFMSLKQALKASPCRVYMSNMKVRIDKVDAFFYPDVFVTCDRSDRVPDADFAKRHPLLIVEVLSDSTAAYDRGLKFEYYRQIPDLRDYVLIETERAHADLFSRNDAGLWVLRPIGPGETLDLSSIGLALPLESCYEDIIART
ncbi:MAG TPA: Uma2 family endonuclease [Rhodocyclaceae bacterium]|nr:Uma2 family endonuclease [Rhodocyclaceae bacterium]